MADDQQVAQAGRSMSPAEYQFLREERRKSRGLPPGIPKFGEEDKATTEQQDVSALSPETGGEIRQSEQYPVPDGPLETSLGALDYATNVMRSGAIGLMRGGKKGMLEHMSQAINFQRQVSAPKIKAALEESKMLPIAINTAGESFFKGALGPITGATERLAPQLWNKLVDFGTNVSIDFLLDPLNAATLGMKRVLPVALSGEAKNLFTQGVADVMRGVDSVPAKTYKAYQEGSRATIGALLGAGLGEKDDTFTERMAKIGAGALLPATVSHGVPYVAKKALPRIKSYRQAVNEGLANLWARVSGKQTEAQAMETGAALTIASKVAARNHDIEQGILLSKGEIVGNLSAMDRIRFTHLFNSTKNYMAGLRKPWIENVREEASRAEEIARKAFDDGKMNSSEFNRAMDGINQTRMKNERNIDIWATKETIPYYNNLLAKEGKEVAQAAAGWIRHNESIVANVNKWGKGLAEGKVDPTDLRGLFGIKWHIDDVYDFVKSTDDLGRQTRAAALMRKKLDKSAFDLSEAVARGDMPKKLAERVVKELDDRYAIYTKSIVNSMMSRAERDAVNIARNFSELSKVPVIRQWEQGLKAYDYLTSKFKSNVLFGGLNWVMNTMHEAIGKTFMEGGYLAAIGGAKNMAHFWSNQAKTINGLLRNEIIPNASQDVLDAYRYGALNGVHMNSYRPDVARLAHGGMQDLEKEMYDTIGRYARYINLSRKTPMTKEEIVDMVKSLPPEAWQATIGRLKNNTAKLGSYFEMQGRTATYQAMLESIKNNPGFDSITLEAKKQIAGQFTSKAFFDYTDVTWAEKAIAQRFFPFWNFYSKNFPYWVKAMFDPDKLSKIKVTESMFRQTGSDIDPEEKKYLSPYIKESAPRFLGKDDKGNYVYAINPTSPFHDAIQMITPHPYGAIRQLLLKGNPFLKLGGELGSLMVSDNGIDFFASDMKKIKIDPRLREGFKEQGIDIPASKTKFMVSPFIGSEDQVKYMYGAGIKYFLLSQFFQKNFPTIAKKIATSDEYKHIINLDSHGNPITASAWLPIMDEMAKMFFPTGYIDSLAKNFMKWGEMSADKPDKERLQDLFKIMAEGARPYREVKMSPAAMRYNMTEPLKEQYQLIRKVLKTKMKIEGEPP